MPRAIPAAQRVEIDLRLEGSRLVLAVADNGAGSTRRSASDGQGLASMQRRARRLNGTLEIASGAGSGTPSALTSRSDSGQHRA